MTRMTILFEALYSSIPEYIAFKAKLNKIRLERWKNHYGTPTITFLLTYQNEIKKTVIVCNNASLTSTPWNVEHTINLSFNKKNNILIDESAPSQIPFPIQDEKKGELLKTYNPLGGFTTTPSDPISEKFIEYLMQNKGSIVLEIGAAFGTATLKALENGATVYCNDVDFNNLAVIQNRYVTKLKKSLILNNIDNLILLPGAFPDELSLPNNFYDAILVSRVLHFLPGDKILKSLSDFFKCLKPGGKLFIVCETPYLKNWQKFLPVYNQREAKGIEWPGEINNPKKYENSGFVSSLPKFVHWITKDVMKKCLNNSNFKIDYLSYIDRKGQFPKELLLDGRESIGSISIKPL
jgi:SAM-dependent methyltransferase